MKEQDNHIDELKTYAPSLVKRNKIRGFKVPDHYFDQLIDHLAIEKKELSVPENYFDQLTDRIMDNVNKNESKPKSKIFSLQTLAVAASFLFLLSVAGWIYQDELMAKNQTFTMNLQMDDQQVTDVLQYSDATLSDLIDYGLLTEEDLNFDLEIADEFIHTDEMEEYWSEEELNLIM